MRRLAIAFFLIAGAIMVFAAFNSEGLRAYFWSMLAILEFSLALSVWTGWLSNMTTVHCVQCEKPLPFLRRPTSMHQALFGGYSCTNCGCEMDRWGRALPQKAEAL